MTGKNVPQGPDRLKDEAQRFDFYQAVRLIEGRAAKRKEVKPVGAGSDPRDEAVRFAANMDGAFPSSDIAGYKPEEQPGSLPVLTTNFIGLSGAYGPLPTPITEMVLNRRRLRDHESDAAISFLDIFNHRLISLMMRIRRMHRPALQFGSPEKTDFSSYLWSLLGLGNDALRLKPNEHDADIDRSFLYLTGLLNQRPVSLHAVERMVRHYIGAPVRGTPFQGNWLDLPDDQTTILGRSGQNNRLGQTAILGRRVWDQAAGIRLELGPLNLTQFASLLPTGSAHARLRKLLGFMLGGTVSVSLSLHLITNELGNWFGRKPVDKAPMKLGSGELRLGWNSWLLTRGRYAEKGQSKPFETYLTLRLGEVS